jgi:hypothetical protein
MITPKFITAKEAVEAANLFNESKFFLSKSHNTEDLFPLINFVATEGKYDTSEMSIKLDCEQYFLLQELGYKIDCVYVDSPIANGKKILIKNVISWKPI